MKISKLENVQTISDNATVKVTEMGNIIEIQYMDKRNHKQTVKVLNSDEYVIVSTGEVKQCKHHSTRYDNKVSLYKTFKTLRGIINSNVVRLKGR